MYDAGGHSAIQCSVRDITEREQAARHIGDLTTTIDQQAVAHRQLEASFIEAQKMEVLGHLACGVAHDFNNVLAIIMGYGDLIASDLPLGSPLHQYTDEIRHASDRAIGLTRQLLIFSRKHAVRLVVLDLNDTVTALERMLRRLVHENISLTFALGPHVGHVMADSGYIGQVLMNLVIDARDAMPDGGALTVTTQDVPLGDSLGGGLADAIPGDYVLLTVSDTGTRMTDAVKAHVFEPLFTTKAAGKGTGLGLATCRTILHQSGGYITVDSDVGKGTAVRMYFLASSGRPRRSCTRSRPDRPAAWDLALLVVEDEPAVRHLARDVWRLRATRC